MIIWKFIQNGPFYFFSVFYITQALGKKKVQKQSAQIQEDTQIAGVFLVTVQIMYAG